MRMKRMASLVAALVAVVFCGIMGMKASAAGGSTSLGASASSVNIGDSVSVTLNVSADVYAAFRINVSYPSDLLTYTGASSDDCNGGGGVLQVLSEVNGNYSITLNFKATAPGTASISASTSEAMDIDTYDEVEISGSSASVTVNNAAASEDPPAEGTTTPPAVSGAGTGSGATTPQSPAGETGTSTQRLSPDNSLKTLTISPGTISPEFKYNRTSYTATVGADVTSVAVDAKTSNSKASVESVTGNTDLKPGENTIKIVVKAENGTLATYKIVVTRSEAAANEPEDGGSDGQEGDSGDGEADGQEGNPEDGTQADPLAGVAETPISFNGISYEVSETLPDTALPEEFSKTTVSYGEREVEAYSFPYGGLTLFYLNPAEGSPEDAVGGFYFYDAQGQAFFPYVNLGVGKSYSLVLPLSYAGALPEGFQEATLTVGGVSVSGCQQADGTAAPEFYQLFCMSKEGTQGWYQYDMQDESLQRYVQPAPTPAPEPEPAPEVEQGDSQPDEEVALLQEAYAKLEKEYQDETEATSRRTMAFLILLAAAIIAIIALIIALVMKGSGKKKKDSKEEIDYIDFDDL